MKTTKAYELIAKVLNEIEHSIATDWLAYCIDNKINFEVLEDKETLEIKSLKSGIPAVG